MAAKQQGKKKAKTGKRKQLQKSHRLARQKQRKLQAHKQKKPWPRRAHKAKAAKPCFSKLYATKMLRQMPKVRMEAKARLLVKTLLTRLYKLVTIEVKNLEKKSESSNVSGPEVQTALNDVMAKLLAKHKPKPTDPIDPLASSQCA
ncbi:hypothetical protein lerEdw1_015548 [Lerista edwardsae]|nr:hypothetical protein lerEdw1_015548 [Lerista edwardsae]